MWPLSACSAVSCSWAVGWPPPALAQSTQTSLLIFPIFDIVGANQTKISITNNSGSVLLVRLTFVCQASDIPPATARVCKAVEEMVAFAAHETHVFDVATEVAGLGGNCPTGEGFIVATADRQCGPSDLECRSQQDPNISAIVPGAPAPMAWNWLSGSYQLFYHGSTNAPALLCGGVPCSPPAAGPNPDVEEGNAIAIQAALHPQFFLGPDGRLRTRPAVSFDGAETNFAAPGAPLIAGPGNPDTVSGTELQTNFILLDLHTFFNATNPVTSVTIQVWNWLGVGFTTSTQFVCWERIPVTTIDGRFAVGLLGSPYGSARFTPLLAQGGTPALLGVVEQVADVGRTIRPMVVHQVTLLSSQ